MGLADGDGEEDGEGEGDGKGEGEGEGERDPVGTTWTWTVELAAEVPLLAVRLNVVVHWSWTVRVPLGSTVPIPLSIWTESAPATSQLRVVKDPELTEVGLATKLWIESEDGPVN
ncbi:MAG TPA: hypothetical protein VN083_05845 [Vicinamibacteria bacterium]|nr:hypothetical protein [Vicinamibacteria bacterium]